MQDSPIMSKGEYRRYKRMMLNGVISPNKFKQIVAGTEYEQLPERSVAMTESGDIPMLDEESDTMDNPNEPQGFAPPVGGQAHTINLTIVLDKYGAATVQGVKGNRRD